MAAPGLLLREMEPAPRGAALGMLRGRMLGLRLQKGSLLSIRLLEVGKVLNHLYSGCAGGSAAPSPREMLRDDLQRPKRSLLGVHG